jgi:hypothetical protein
VRQRQLVTKFRESNCTKRALRVLHPRCVLTSDAHQRLPGGPLPHLGSLSLHSFPGPTVNQYSIDSWTINNGRPTGTDSEAASRLLSCPLLPASCRYQLRSNTPVISTHMPSDAVGMYSLVLTGSLILESHPSFPSTATCFHCIDINITLLL